MNFSFTLKKNDALLKVGHEVAKEQIQIQAFSAITEIQPEGKIKLEENVQGWQISASDFELFFNENKGVFENYSYKGTDYIKKGPQPDFWRVPTENDYGFGMVKKRGIWKEQGAKATVSDIKLTQEKGIVNIVVTKRLDDVFANFISTYIINGKGEIQVDNFLEFDPNRKTPNIPRVGSQLRLNKELNQVKWYGRGPHENYRDRYTSAFVGTYTSSVDSLYFPYIRPQENGYRTEVKTLRFYGENKGIKVVSKAPIGFNAQYYEHSDYANALKKTTQPPI